MSATAAYPRVLIVAANVVNRVQSAGILLGSLFEGWPRDRLAQIYFPLFHRFPPNAQVCTQYLRVNPLGLTRREQLADPPPGSAPRAPAAEKGAPRATAIDGIAHKVARSSSLRAPLIDPLRETLALFPWLDRRLIEYARQFDPDVVYTLLGTIGIIRSVAIIADELDRPVVPHFTDTWIDTRFVGAPFEQRLREQLFFWVDRVLERSPVLLTVSGVMAQEYESRFGTAADVLTQLVEADPYRCNDEPAADGRPLRLVYTGNLGLRRADELRRVGSALKTLRAEGFDATLEVYTPDSDRELFAAGLEIPGVLRMCGWVPASELPQLLTSADVLVHVESDHPDVLPFTRLSFSTKLSQYMMAGRCLLVVGPPDAGCVKELKRMEAGIVAHLHPPEQIVGALRRALGDQTLRRDLGHRARALALEHFEATRHREKFRRILNAAAESVDG
jgi:glycosyltransferase involved in cell wall biosynthesis